MRAGTGVAIVHYRSYADLCVCLASLVVYEPRTPVVVVDHASDEAALDALRLRFPSVRFLGTPANPGFAAGANRAIRALDSERVLVLNPDCRLKEPLLATLNGVLDEHPEVGVVGPRVLNGDGTVQPSARRFPDATTALAGRRSWLSAIAPGNALSRRNLIAAAPGDGMRHVDWVSGACILISRKAFDAVGGFDESYFLYWEDADFCRRLLGLGLRTAYCPSVSVAHPGARCSRFNARRALIAFHVSAFRYYRTHAGVAGRLFSPIVALLLGGRLAFALTYQAITGLFGGEPAEPTDRAGAKFPHEV